jgi:oxysterol 7-alpha-hydroxylase
MPAGPIKTEKQASTLTIDTVSRMQTSVVSRLNVIAHSTIVTHPPLGMQHATMDALQLFLSQRLSSGGMLVISIAVGVCLIYNLRPRRVRPGDSGPPIVPYKIPYLQHLPAFLWNPGKLYREMQARYPGRPFTLWLNNTKFHVFYETSTVNHIFSRSRTFSFDPVMASMMENGIILPPEDLLKFSPPAELEGKERADSRRFITANHNIWSKYLAGKPLEKIMEIYMQNFNAIMGQHLDLQGTQWQTVDFHELVQRMIFETTVLTFFGPRIKKIWGNNMWDDWKLYDQATYIGVRSKLAIILQPRVYLAYRRMMVAFEKWIDSGSTEWPATDGIRNEQWGARMNWERDRLGVECGFSLRGRACLQAGFLWV